MSKPSEKAMQLSLSLSNIFTGKYAGSLSPNLKAAAELISAHTAETLSEHKRVIEMAEKALAQAEFHLAVYDMKLPTITEALAEIAKLRKE
jgi:hypothetical protein